MCRSCVAQRGRRPAFSLDFVELNCYAFITLTTTGYGDMESGDAQSQC